MKHRLRFSLLAVVAVGLVVVSTAAASTNLNLLPGTAVLLSKSGSGPLSSTSTSTNTFSPAAYADYKHFGGEPTAVVDRYPLTTGTFKGKACSAASPCYPDYAYACSPQGFVEPHYSTFLKSSDLGETFRVTNHFPATDEEQFNAGGGGDCYIAVGQVSHKVFFTDLPANCVTLNVSSDFGESFVPGPQACGTTPGAVDDRNWVAVDELAPGDAPPATGHVYVSFINFTNGAAPTLEAQVSDEDGNDATAGFAASPCNAATIATGSVPVTGGVQAPDSQPTPCPDPADSYLDVAGPPVVDPVTHNVYIPFIRATPVIPDVSSGPPFSLWIAKSTDLGQTWTRIKVADLGTHDPVNIFPELASDTGGNLYYTWSQTQAPTEAAPGLGGEQDVYYSFSTNQGATWATPIDLTKEPGDSAVFPWMVAGSPGEVDLVFYKASTGLNSNVAAVDQNGNPSSCTPDGSSCFDNPSVWNVYFSSSQNALNSGANFKAVQISSQPNHLGQVCTAGLGCTTGGNRDLLDFFTVDVDHLGAANVIWADDNNSNSLTINRFSRQLSGASVFKNTNISLATTWPITDHAVTDPSGDVANGNGVLVGTCPGMDLLGTSEQASNGLLTVTLKLNNAPTAAEATSCSALSGTTGGVWGAEFWSSSSAGSDNFYIAYRDNPPDGTARGEAGRVDHLNATVTSADFDPTQAATVGGTCFNAGGAPSNRTPCTVILTTSLSALGVKPGAGIYSITGLATYQFGSATPAPFTNLNLGNNEQADAATAFDDNGTGKTG
jgi:hypothetical protein